MRFSRSAVLLLVAVAAGSLSWLYRAPERPAPAASRPILPPAPATAFAAAATPASSPAATDAGDVVARRAERRTRLAYAHRWENTSIPTLAAFRAWTERYRRAADPAARAALEGEGVFLARQRRAAMLHLIRRQPAEALAVTVPAAIRRELPPAVLAQLESRVAGTGEFALQQAQLAPDAAPGRGETSRRTVYLEDTTFTAHPYGRRLAQTTEEGASLHGIALAGEFALHESPLRLLEADEIPGADIVDRCPVTHRALAPADPAAPVGEAALVVFAHGRLWQLDAGDDALEQFEQRLIAAEEREGPIVPALAPNGTVAPPRAADPATPWTIGAKKILVIRVDFPDFPGEPIAAGTFSDTINGPVREFFEENSYGLTTFTATVSPTVYRMPATGASYATANNSSGLHTAARTAAAADYTMADYDRIMVVFTNLRSTRVPGSQFGFGGLATVGGTNSWLNGSFGLGVTAHELGHNWGLKHSSLWVVNDGNPLSAAGSSREYGDPFDMMGDNASRDGRYHFNHWCKNQLGWLPDAAVTVPAASGTYRISRYDSPAANRAAPLALRVFRDGVRWYWVGHRQALPGSTLGGGANVIWGFNAQQESQLIDFATPGTNPNDSALPVGATLDDTVAGVKLRTAAQGGAEPAQWLDIEVTLPAAPPDVAAAWGTGLNFLDTPTAVTNTPIGLNGIRALAGGTGHAVALRANGTVVAWGDNVFGQATVPQINDLVASVAAGGNVSGAVLRDGRAILWGSGIGQLLTPPEGLSGVRKLAIGNNHVLALKTDGTVVAWGSNAVGQTALPAGLDDAVDIAAGNQTSVILRRNGAVVALGGTGIRTVPAAVTGVVAVAAGGTHALALRGDGTVAAWGNNGNGQINVPAGLNNVVAVAAGDFHSLALKSDGTVVAWGSATGGKTTVPSGLPRAHTLAASAQGSFAVVGAGLYLTQAPANATVAAGGTAVLRAEAAAAGAVTYQWRKDGVAVPGATAATLTLAAATAANAGRYTVVVTGAGRTIESSPAVVTVTAVAAGPEVSRIANLSIRTNAGTGAQTLIVGFVVGGGATTGSKPLVIRGIGPTLAAFGVTGALVDPRMEVYAGTVRVAENDNWSSSDAGIFASVGAFALTIGSRDAAIYNPTVAAGGYSAQISGNAGATGVTLAEIYDATPSAAFTATTPRLVNVSARTVSGSGAETLIAGFAIAGPTPKTVLIRAIGPTLSAFGVTDVLADPKLELFNSSAVKVQENDNWGGTAELTAAFASVGAFALPAAARDAALLARLQPGTYTAQISGNGGANGVALVEIYEVP